MLKQATEKIKDTVKNMMKDEKALRDCSTHYCPGCGHGIIHKLVGEVIDELNIRGSTIGTAPVGCAVLLYDYFNLDIIECAHGRVPAVATGIKRVHPDKTVFCYQGDGDLAAIGTAEIIHAANRGENLTVIFVNNAIYGMTGGQMAPTTLVGQKTSTSPSGRDAADTGKPIKVCELLKNFEGVKYIERTAVNSIQNIIKTKEAIKKAFENQINKKGFSIVEILAMCPTGWKQSPEDSLKFIENQMSSYFPLGKVKDSA